MRERAVLHGQELSAMPPHGLSASGSGTMSRRYRSWACGCCGREWARGKTFFGAPICSVCDRSLTAARTPRERKVCRHDRAAATRSARAIRIETRPRTQSGLALRPPAAVKKLWRDVQAAKTRPAIARRGQTFLDALMAYANDANETTGRWRVLRNETTGRVVGKSRGSGIPIPNIRLAELSGGTLGLYRSGFRSGWSITLDPRQTVTDLRTTLIHEVMHALDTVAGVNDHYHGTHWRTRLSVLAAMFPPDQR